MHPWFAQYLQERLEQLLPDPYERICADLASGEPLAFSRFGDGELAAVFGVRGANCDGHPFYPDMGERLAAIIAAKPPYLMGMQTLALLVHGARSILEISPGVSWVLADSFHNASMEGRLGELFDALAGRDVTIVGPPHLESFATDRGWTHFPVPAQDCWRSYDEVRDRLTKALPNSGAVFMFSASMMSNVLIDDLHRLNPNNSYLDAGSLFDPYVGVESRDYHGKLGADPLAGISS